MVISNASPLIALHQIEQFHILPDLFDTILIPSAVAAETTTIKPFPQWIQMASLTQSIAPMILRASLGDGESEAISLALETDCQLLILDDRPARRLAQTIGIPIIGTLGVLVAAKRRSLVPAIKPSLHRLKQVNFHISDALYEFVLRAAEEL